MFISIDMNWSRANEMIEDEKDEERRMGIICQNRFSGKKSELQQCAIIATIAPDISLVVAVSVNSKDNLQ